MYTLDQSYAGINQFAFTFLARMSINIDNDDRNNSGSGTRRRSLRRGDESSDNTSSNKRLKQSPRLIQYCTGWFLPRNICCSGCVDYIETLPVSDNTSAIEAATATRHVTHTYRKYTCTQPWRTADKDVSPRDKVWISRVKSHCSAIGNIKRLEIDRSTLVVPPPAQAGEEDPVDSPLDPSKLFGTPAITPPSDGGKTKDEVDTYVCEFTSRKHPFKVTLPKTHTVIHTSDYSIYKKERAIVKSLRDSLGHLKFPGGASQLMQSLIVTALVSCPALPLSAAAHIIPVIVGAFLLPSGVLDYSTFDVQLLSTSFPSETWYRNAVIEVASRNCIELAHNIFGKSVYIACDKGSKKGVSHFVKNLSWWSGNRVHRICLDIDGSGGTTKECGDAISHSLKKVTLQGCQRVRLHGQSTDSGGGGVLDGLAKELQKRNLCIQSSQYLVSSCAIHNLQLTLANPMKELLGEGTSCIERGVSMFETV